MIIYNHLVYSLTKIYDFDKKYPPLPAGHRSKVSLVLRLEEQAGLNPLQGGGFLLLTF